MVRMLGAFRAEAGIEIVGGVTMENQRKGAFRAEAGIEIQVLSRTLFAVRPALSVRKRGLK